MTPLDILLTGYDITDEVINRTSSASLKLDHDTIRGSADVEIWTGAGGTGTQLSLTTDYTIGSEDTRLTTAAGVTIYKTLAIVNGAYHATDLYVTYKTVGDYASVASVRLAAIKTAIEYVPLLDIFPNLKYRAPAAWDPENPRSYFPRLCLTDFDTYKDVSTANWLAEAIDELRSIKIVFKENLTGEIASPVVTGWAISSNVATLTFQNNADHIAFLAALLEDEAQHGSYTSWRTVTLASTIGSITAGTYALTNVNASARTVSFALTAANGSGSGTFAADFYAYRIAGSTTTARVFSARGLSLMGVNDANGYFVSGGLRRRGFFQGHRHDPASGLGNLLWSASNGASAGTARLSPISGGDLGTIGNPLTDGTNGTPRTAKETNSPALSVHLYLHMGEYVA